MSFWTNSNVEYIRSAIYDGRQTATACTGTYVFNASASHGSNGYDGNGETSKTYASSGGNGSRGGSAKDIQILILAPKNGSSFWVSQGTPTTVTSHPLFSASTSLKLLARGGNGGSGGDGGDGMNGRTGSHGMNATQYSSGTNGGNGTPGGNGGNGGNGANGGDGGDITVNVQRDDVDLLLSIDQIDTMGGLGGRGGSGGTGGRGGAGGTGGSSYSWTTTHRNSDGSTSTVYHSNAGGYNGSRGAHGREGEGGANGAAGVSGNYFIRVHDMDKSNVTAYKSIYDLYALQTGIVDASLYGGVIEPGQVVPLTDIIVGNKGGMPSPALVNPSGNKEHGICITIANTPLLNMITSTAVILPVAIDVDSQHCLRSALKCNILRVAVPAPDSPPLQYAASLQLAAYSTRLMRYIPNFPRAAVNITVRYPVEISAVKGGRTGLAGDHIPFAVCIKSIATIAQGENAARPRTVRVKVEVLNLSTLTDKSKIVFNTCTPATSATQAYKLGSGPVYFDIPVLAGCTTEALTGSIVCQPGCVATYTAVNIRVTLLLGDIDVPLKLTNASGIQRVTHSFHMVEECGSFPKPGVAVAVSEKEKEKEDTVGFEEEKPAEVAPVVGGGNNLLLVVNGTTTSEEIQSWKVFAAALQMSFVLYDAAYYNGFHYSMSVLNVLEEMSNGLVVILNNSYFRNDDPAYFNNAFYVNQFLRTSTIFEAARRRSIRTYVINGNEALDMRQLAYPSETFAEPVAHTSRTAFTKATAEQPFAQSSEWLPAVHDLVSVSTKCVFFSPSEKKLAAKVEGLDTALAKIRPDRTYFTIQNYNKEKLSTSFLFISKYRAGTVECRRGLDNTNALIGLWNLSVSSNVAPRNHYFAAMKLLPFEKKLALLSNNEVNCNPDFGYILVNAVLSDIADEVSLFVLHKRDYLMSGIPSAQLPTCMLKLEAFAAEPFPDFLKATLLKMTARLETLFLRIRTKWGLTHPYTRYLLETLYALVGRLAPESISSKRNAAKYLSESFKEETLSAPSSPTSPTSPTSPKSPKPRGVRFSLMAMRDPFQLITEGALTFNNSIALANDPAIAAVDGAFGTGRPMFKFNTEKERMDGVANFTKTAGIVSTNGGKVKHSGSA